MTDNVLERVRKILTKAEDPGCTPEEAAALNAKAAELIAKYGVDRALLAAERPETDIVGDRRVVVSAPYALDKSSLLTTIASAMRCRSVRTRQRASCTIHLFGFDSDLERVELLYTSLLVQASFGLAAAPVPSFESPAAFRRTWLIGFAQAIGHRLREAERQAEASATSATGPSVALVLADRRQIVDRRVSEQYPELRTAPPRRLMGSGLSGGYAAGRRADLGATAVGRRAPRQVSR